MTDKKYGRQDAFAGCHPLVNFLFFALVLVFSMNPVSALIWMNTPDPSVLLTYYLTGFPIDCVRAAATWLFLWLGAEPMLDKLDRIKVKYGLVE